MSNKIKLFKQKAYKRAEVGSWIYEWHVDEKHPDRSFMRIMSNDYTFELRLKPNFNSFGYLLAAAEQGLNSQLENYARLLFSVAALDTLDQELDNDLWLAIDRWRKRQFAKGAENAKRVTEEQEMADTAFMQSVVDYANATPKERKEISKQDKAILRELLNEDKEGEG